MYGSHIGQLNVYFKYNDSALPDKPAWSLSGNQGNTWHRATSLITDMTRDFRVCSFTFNLCYCYLRFHFLWSEHFIACHNMQLAYRTVYPNLVTSVLSVTTFLILQFILW